MIMNKIVYCSGCSIKVAIIVEGSKLIKGISMLCSSCEIKRKASDLAEKTSKKSQPFSDYSDLFGDIFKNK